MVNGLARLRNGIRSKFFDALRHVAAIDDTRDILSGVLAQQNVSFAHRNAAELENFESPYAEGDHVVPLDAARERPAPLLITARFRTGSTLLWKLFRGIPGLTAYYEPFNERRWFDECRRGNRVDDTHLGVDEYWSEYRGLAELGQYYREDWTRRELCMTATSWNPAMQRYIELMIERAPGRAVLQFNRVDLRLPWLRARFPRAKILHLYRDPRDQWCSTLPALPVDMRELRIGGFEPFDGFYLLPWARDLRRSFPFLNLDANAHPYEVFYQLWKLSYACGRSYAHLSLSYESLVANPRGIVDALLSELGIDGADPAALAAQVVDGKRGRWQQLADERWFRDIETRVDQEFRRYFARPSTGRSTLLAAPGNQVLRAG